ncbi:hypothetical protein H7F10_07305 [Acidithiobacillus sp. HP-6]|uniref:rhodanese-like domain-containing protein n=1 Tax=unclassified Acidithiobacillus TaxID=2614800 RepID=UPI001879483B|nr:MULTISPECIES: rhodanese-like domain-containing protein [unclassified Acidithiobacillus]MBE7562759.1 hypothetical protein [Acidithiobacillus sp. HP-6]MBE7568897.1 hypothetical protein [Acidithiobacillus sp. HP-2]
MMLKFDIQPSRKIFLFPVLFTNESYYLCDDMSTLKSLIYEAHEAIHGMMPNELHHLILCKAIIVIDVREADELSHGSIPGAIAIPRGIIEMAADLKFRGHHKLLAPARQMKICCICDCPSAGRSSLAALALKEMEFVDVSYLKGGIPLWVADGYNLNKIQTDIFSVKRR